MPTPTPPAPMPMMEMAEMRRMMTRHMAVTNEILGIVRENQRLLGLLNQYVVGGVGVPPKPREDVIQNQFDDTNQIETIEVIQSDVESPPVS